MATLVYGQSAELHFDDRVLAHIQLVIGLKLRRNESFFFSWIEEGDTPRRTSIWLDQAVPLVFRYSGLAVVKINRSWLEILTISSNSAQGLQLSDEADTGSQPTDQSAV